MTDIPYKLIQVFSDPAHGFRGNISAVMMLKEPLSKDEMQRIASDFNQPATTFLLEKGDGEYTVRWYAPDSQIGLCGHGAMAATAYLIEEGIVECTQHFGRDSVKGRKTGDQKCRIDLDPIDIVEEEEDTSIQEEALGIPVKALYRTGNKHILLTDSEESVRAMKPDFARLRDSNIFGYAVTAPGNEVDFVSRTIVPHVQQLEDHATGSSHAMLAPFWAKKLGKQELNAWQLSPRRGKFKCHISENQVGLEGGYDVLAQGNWHVKKEVL